MDRQLRDALEQVINYLDANGLRYAIVGGIALSYWNVSRFTYDIDIKLLDELQVWVCTAEDLIIQKVVASREKDWPDVEALLIEQWHTLDQSYVEDWLSQFSDALETPELLSRYLSLRGKIQRIIE